MQFCDRSVTESVLSLIRSKTLVILTILFPPYPKRAEHIRSIFAEHGNRAVEVAETQMAGM